MVIILQYTHISNHLKLMQCCCCLVATLWTVACQDLLSMGFSSSPRILQEYWSGLPFLPPGDLPNPGSHPCLLHWQADSLPLQLHVIYVNYISIKLEKSMIVFALKTLIPPHLCAVLSAMFKVLCIISSI